MKSNFLKKNINSLVLSEQEQTVDLGDYYVFNGEVENGKPKKGSIKKKSSEDFFYYNKIDDNNIWVAFVNGNGFLFPYLKVKKSDIGGLTYNNIEIFTEKFFKELNRWDPSKHQCIMGKLCCGNYGDNSVVSGKYSPTDKRFMEINSQGIIYFNIDGQLFYSDNKVRKTTSRKLNQSENETDIGGTWAC